MIVTVTPNPALDLTYHLDTFIVGESHRVAPASARAGGKGINVARVLHERGYPTHIVAPAGGASGDLLREDLTASGLTHSLLPVHGPTRHTTAIVTPAQTTNLNESGTPLEEADWGALAEFATAALTHGPGRRVLVISGSIPPHAPADAVVRLVRAAHEARAVCLVDTSGPHLLAAAHAGADVLKPNHHELLALGLSNDGVLPSARILAARSGGLVFASLGADGLLRVPADGPIHQARLRSALTGNTTGAGDAAVAALAAAWFTDAAPDPQRSLAAATAWSAAAVLHPLAGSITDPEPLLAQIDLTETV